MGNQAWEPDGGIVALLKYKHLPVGCGVWPSFWSTNTDVEWPAGGELDIIEFANTELSKITFHSGPGCSLDSGKTARCRPQGSRSYLSTNCHTSYYKGLLGCYPMQIRRSGEDMSRDRGIAAIEWTSTHINVYHIPEHEIPADITTNRPAPETWSRFLLTHMPFRSSCPTIGKQEFVINLQMCGDWAGGAWSKGSCPASTGYYPGVRCKRGLSDPRDCCTQYVTSDAATSTLQSNAFFDIEYLKVYTGNGVKGSRAASAR